MKKTGDIQLDSLVKLLRDFGFRAQLQDLQNSRLRIFMRKGQWGKLGFLPIHLGILVIISGGFVTSHWGFRGTMNIPDGETSQRVYIPSGESYSTLELPFEIRNNGFQLDYYINGMPRGYRSNLEVIQDNRRLAAKDISVNDPLSIGDTTIYQASFGDAGSAVNISITDLSRPAFNIQQLDSAVHRILEDDETGTRFTLAELRSHNVINLSADPLKTVMRDLGPSLDIRLQSAVDGTITYRVYKDFPNMVAFTRLGDTDMTTFDLGLSPTDQKLMSLLSSYLQNTHADGEQTATADTRRQAFRQAMLSNAIPLSRAQELEPVIIRAAETLSQHRLPALFQLNSFDQKLYTGLQVSKDPGANIIWVGSGLLIIGLLMFYVSEYRIWLIIDQQVKSTRIQLALASNRKTSVNQRYLMQRLVASFQSVGFVPIQGTRP